MPRSVTLPALVYDSTIGAAAVGQRGERVGALDRGARPGAGRTRRCSSGIGARSGWLAGSPSERQPGVERGQLGRHVEPRRSARTAGYVGIDAGQQVGDEVLELVDVDVGGDVHLVAEASLIAQLPAGHLLDLEVGVAQRERLGATARSPRAVVGDG